MSWSKRILFGLMAAFLSCLFCLAAVEALFRIRGDELAEDLAFGSDFDRSQMVFYSHPDRSHPWSTGGEDPLQIAVIGDSITNGSGVQPDDSYGQRMERILNLNRDQRPAEVRIYAKGGTSTYMQLGFLKEALTHDPEVVILGICLNDTEDWVDARTIESYREGMLPRPPPIGLGFLVKHSRVVGWLYGKVDALRMHQGHLDYYRKIHDPSYSGVARFTQAVDEFKAQCDAHQARLVVVIFPLLSWDLAPGKYPFGESHQAITSFLRSRQLPTIDLLQAYTGKSPRRLQVVPNLDGHPNEIAHRIAAEKILQFLLENGMIDAGYKPEHMAFQSMDYWRTMRQVMAGKKDVPAAAKPLADN